MKKIKNLLEKLNKNRSLTLLEYEQLILGYSKEAAEYAAALAVENRKRVYGTDIYIRGLIEVSNVCKNDCYYCGIRCSNKNCDRYRLTKEDILLSAKEGYELGFRTFVMQGGEDPHFTDEFLVDVISSLKKLYPDCAVTLSLGERSKESYAALKAAGADRYLLRHETAEKEHYQKLHPENMSFDNRMECLKNLKELGFQVGCGFMVGSPYQTVQNLAKDLKFVEEFAPDMCGIGPYLTHKDTPFNNMPSGSFELTLYLLSIIRLISPEILLPATTALGTINPKGRELGILAGANVIMPNLSPMSVREKYMLYDNKACIGDEAAESVNNLKRSMEAIGYTVVCHRGDKRVAFDPITP
ncbi:MAG: [Clostridia bacterium]|nr:[FeFe] hydrogenase H-cluster radical SAM maturase HydE [Clostridia bacterium]